MKIDTIDLKTVFIPGHNKLNVGGSRTEKPPQSEMLGLHIFFML